MRKRNSILLILFIVVTFLSVFVWSTVIFSFLNEKEASAEESSNLIVEVKNKQSSSDILLKGVDSNVLSSLIVLKFDPEIVEVTEIVDGDLFDIYVGGTIDNENGFLYIAGAFTEERDISSNNFARINFEKLGSQDPEFKLVEFDSQINETIYSHYVNREGDRVEISN